MDARSSYRQAAGRGASGVQLVVLLYEQIIHDLGRAIKAIEAGDIEARTRELNHALKVIAHLQTTLNLEVKGHVVPNLMRFYATLRARLLEAQAKASPAMLQEQIGVLLEMREAWTEVDRAVNGSQPPAREAQAPGPRSHWRG
ncbi:MAG TPA: flagellar export chaperone FliS [Terriglobales bacterium]|nr:flagellar export chaperone FliS [Terriglobales bacterium]